MRQKWVFPAEILPANGFLIVFASRKDRGVAGAELHTNFNLTSAGEYLALFAPGASEPSTVFDPYPPQFENTAYGEGATVTTSTPVSTGASCRWRIPTSNISNWAGSTFNDSSWTAATTGVGYETSSSNTYTSLISPNGNTRTQMFNSRTSAYIRIPFNVAEADRVSGINLRMKYDDGFAAFINGVQIAGDRDPDSLTWNSIATANHDDTDALVFTNFEVTDLPVSLTDGENILAIQGLNRATNSSDFLIIPELDITTSEIQPDDLGFLLTPSPNAVNSESFDGLVEDTKFSLNRGFYSLPINVEITTGTPDAQIRYTTDGSPPTASSGNVYATPIQIGATTVLRAAAFKDGFAPTNVDTQTYIFTNSVRIQAEMDPEITTDGAYSNLMDTALRGNLPIMSLATLNSNLFGGSGIYTNSQNSGRSAEVPLSVEYFTPTGSEEFQIDAGVRIHGGNARSHPKKPLRLYFRRDYGEGKLRYPLFPGSPVDEFDQLLLRGGGHDSWSLAASFGRDDTDLPPHGTIMRDQFLRRIEVEMGILSPRGKYVHVYINGQYWGVYDLHERANEDFFADHGGGQPEDYDVLHHPEFVGPDYSLVSGDDAAWNTMQNLARSGIFNEAQYQAIQEYLDIDSYINAMITRMWSGDYDWCGPIFVGNSNRTVFGNKNWYAGRRSRNGDGKFQFFSWDAEMSMGLHLMSNLGLAGNPTPAQRVTNFDLTQADDSGSPVALYDRLRNYLEFRVRFADLLQKHLFHTGVMSTTSNRLRLEAMEREIENAMIAESARWGDEGFGDEVFDRDDEWRSEVNWLKHTFIAARNNQLITQFRNQGMFPSLNAPSFSRRGGTVAVGSSITLSGLGGNIYYTLDGSDPRLVGGGISPTAQIYNGPISLPGPSVKVRVRTRVSTSNWSALDEVTFIVGNAANFVNLAITEIHYHPANPSTPAELATSENDTDFEFIELTNIWNTGVVLSNIEFTQGVSFKLDSSAPIQELASGETALIVANRDAFLARYGPALAPRIAGTFADGSKLSNNGETVTLINPFGQVISSFSYTDSSPWPAAADGGGPSLVLRDPIEFIDPAQARSWKASVIIGGTPGGASINDYSSWAAAFFDQNAPDFATISAPTADPDNDGWDNLTEYALGQAPDIATTHNPVTTSVVAVGGQDYAAISYRFQPAFSDITISIEASTDLKTWTASAVTELAEPLEQPDGTSLVNVRLTSGLDRSQPAFLRLRINSAGN